MDETKYKRWQALHRQAVTGEPLNEAEQTEYEASCREMDEEENLDGDVPRLRELRRKIVEADAEKQRMEIRLAELDAKIAALEARLDSRTRQLLGISG